MSLWERIFQGMVAFSSTTVITNLSGVLQAVLTFRYLTVDEYGRLTFMLSFYNAAATFLDMGMGSVFTSEVARARGTGQNGMVRGLLSLYGRLLLGTGASLGLLFGGLGWHQREILWAILGAYLFASALNRGLEALFLSHTLYRRSAAQPVARSLSRLALLATLPWWKPGSALASVALTYPLMEFFTFIFSLWMAWHTLRFLLTVSKEQVDLGKLLQQQGIYVMFVVPIKHVQDELPVWLLKMLSGDMAVGLYGAAHKAFTLLYAFLAPLETILFPLVSEQAAQAPERIRAALRQAQKYAFWLSLALTAFLLPLSPWLISLMAGQAYMQATSVLQWLLGYLILLVLLQSHRPILYALGEQRWLLSLYVLNFLTYAPLLWLGIRWNGAVGAAQALILHGALFIFVRLWVLRRLAPHLWVSPLTVFQVEEFDRQLFRQIKESLQEGILVRWWR